jgi:hypothetical protein
LKPLLREPLPRNLAPTRLRQSADRHLQRWDGDARLAVPKLVT